MGPLYPQGRFPLSRVEIISSKPLPARGLMGPSLPVVPAPSRLASGCLSGVAAGCLASPLRRRGPPGLPVCRSGCAGPAAVACPLPPSLLRGPGRTGCCSELSSLRIGALPLLPCRGPLRSEGWRGPGSGAAIPAHGGNLYHMGGTLLSRPECAGSKFAPPIDNGATITGELHRMAVQPL